MLGFNVGEVFLMLYLGGFTLGETTTVTAPIGVIIGATTNVTFKQDTYEVDVYLGIPYAKPPVRELRFKKPETFGTFTEPFSASHFGHSCPQAQTAGLDMGAGNQSEDCLFLNVYVPRQPADTASGHAVMLYIHGGGFTMGNADLYRGEALASVGNVIVVTINYRLGLLGFLDTDDDKSVGNFGLWDQQMALQWVNSNIGAFGGDKDRVTIFGESAGSMSVAMQMLYPKNRNLFIGGITQSSALTTTGFYKENTIEAAKFYAESLNCSIETMDKVFSCLKSASVEDIIKVVSDTTASMDMTASMKISTPPTIDGEFTKELPEKLFKKVNAGEQVDEIDFFRSLRLINGVNGQEGGISLLSFGRDDNEDFEITREQMNNEQVPGALYVKYAGKQVPEVVKQLVISSYTDWTNPDDPKTIREQYTYLFGDIWFNVPAVEMSHVHSNASNVVSYFYEFNAVPYKRLKQIPSWVKEAIHGEELGPVFGFKFDLKTALNVSEYSAPEWELDLSKRMMTFWSNFAKTGNPNGNKADGQSAMTWPKFNITSQTYIQFDEQDTTSNFPFARQTDLWTNLIPSLLETTAHKNDDCRRQQDVTSTASTVVFGAYFITSLFYFLV